MSADELEDEWRQRLRAASSQVDLARDHLRDTLRNLNADTVLVDGNSALERALYAEKLALAHYRIGRLEHKGQQYAGGPRNR